MSTKLDTYTSTGLKILKQPELIKAFKEGRGKPQSLQLAPTNRCNLKCSFCSVAKRDKQEEMKTPDILLAMSTFAELGVKTVEITGGGEPLLHPDINHIIDYAKHALKLEIGLITNGTLLDRLKHPEHLAWLRISANTLDYEKDIYIPKLSPDTHFGFSYCYDFDGDSSEEVLKKIQGLAIKHKAKYVRVVPNCMGSMEGKHIRIKEIVRRLGEPLFYQEKTKGTYPTCLIGYVKPFLNADGYIYPCSSTVLNADAERQFNPKYRWYHWTDTRRIYSKPLVPIDGTQCPDCVFTENNKIFDYIATPQDCENFL